MGDIPEPTWANDEECTAVDRHFQDTCRQRRRGYSVKYICADLSYPAAAQDADEVARALRLLIVRDESLTFCHRHGNGLSGGHKAIDGVDDAVATARAALSASPATRDGCTIATTALAYLVNAQHDLRTGYDPARAAATISEGVAAVEALLENSHA